MDSQPNFYNQSLGPGKFSFPRISVSAIATLFVIAALFCTTAFGQSVSHATITIEASQPGTVISSNLFGLFYEEINHAGDGGLYGEMIQNRSFEDDPVEPINWILVTNGTAEGEMALDTSLPLSPTNLHALALTKFSGDGTIWAANLGYGGVSILPGVTYDLNFWARASNGFVGNLSIITEKSDDTSGIYSSNSVSITTNWAHYSVEFVATGGDWVAQLMLGISQNGTVYLDFVSLFPHQTFNNRTNGMRADLAQTVQNLKPSFLRFPGGWWVEGSALTNIYHWPLTIGDPADRSPRWDVWGYPVDNGLGYLEYLQYCEDIGAKPAFVVNCGIDLYGDSIPTNQLGPLVQEALDAVSYANDPTNTYWGSLRALNGHPVPFSLEYVEIGNEEQGEAYNQAYAVFYDAFKATYPNIHLIANNFNGYMVTSRPTEIIDTHYYSVESDFLTYATYFDTYDRSGPKVLFGEYSVRTLNARPNLDAALGEAAFMTGLERNSDVVQMASYGCLLANVVSEQWFPVLIYVEHSLILATPSYYVQQMFSLNRGDILLPSTVSFTNYPSAPLPGGAIGVGSRDAQVQFSNIVVTASNGSILYQSDFRDDGTNGWNIVDGDFFATNGVLEQTTTGIETFGWTGETNWADYTVSLQALKIGGNGGFLFAYNVLDDEEETWWSVGGWTNTSDGIEQILPGLDKTYDLAPQSIQTNVWYSVRIKVTGSRAQCYIGTNNSQALTNLIQDVTVPSPTNPPYVSAAFSKSSSQIIVKAVNPTGAFIDTAMDIRGVDSIANQAVTYLLTSDSGTNENQFWDMSVVVPETNIITDAGTNFTINLPPYSLTILRLNSSPPHFFTNLLLQCPAPINVGQTLASEVLAQNGGAWTDITANTYHALAWSSSDTNILAVDVYGNVTGRAKGTATITATYASLGLSASQPVTVVSQLVTPPMLICTFSNQQLTLAWPTSPSGVSLQSTTNLSNPSLWVPVTNTPTILGQQNRITFPLTGTEKFFRLKRN